MLQLKLEKGDVAILTPTTLELTDLSIQPIPVADKDHNLFGLSEKTTRLPGHTFYYKN